MIVTQTLVAQALQRPLTVKEQESLEFLSLEASALISGYVGRDFSDPLVIVPQIVSVVAARMIARSLLTDPAQANIQSQQLMAGPHAVNTTFVPETRGGSTVYITKMDKQMLQPLKPGVINIRMKSERG